MVMTKHGVCYDFKKSPYKYDRNGVTFVFSSQLHLEKFTKKIEENRKKINDSLSNRFDLNVDVSALADIVLYKKIETRGFLIVTQEETELWQKSNLKFVGGKVI